MGRKEGYVRGEGVKERGRKGKERPEEKGKGERG